MVRWIWTKPPRADLIARQGCPIGIDDGNKSPVSSVKGECQESSSEWAREKPGKVRGKAGSADGWAQGVAQSASGEGQG